MGGGRWAGMGEDDLVRESQAGSQGAMAELYRRHRGLVIGYVARMSGDRELADEVFAATFVAFFEHLGGYRPRGQLAAYLLRIARGKLADEARARGRLGRRLPGPGSGDSPGAGPVAAGPGPDEAAETAELAGRAGRALMGLSPTLREVVVLRLYEGLDYASIAAVVGAGEATVRSRMRYALQALRDAMGVTREP